MLLSVDTLLKDLTAASVAVSVSVIPLLVFILFIESVADFELETPKLFALTTESEVVTLCPSVLLYAIAGLSVFDVAFTIALLIALA